MSEFDKVRNFENVKVGDPVICHTRYKSYVTEVTRVTKTCFAIACDCGSLYKKDNGNRRGGGVLDINHCTIATEKAITAIEEEKKKKDLRIQVKGKIQQLNVNYLSIEQLEELGSVLDKFIGE